MLNSSQYFFKKRLCVLCIVYGLLCSLNLYASDYVPKELIVKINVSGAGLHSNNIDRLTSLLSEPSISASLHLYSCSVASTTPGGSVHSQETACYFKVTFKEGAVPELIEQLRKHPSVLAVQPNYIYRIHDIPNDPLYDRQDSLIQLAMAKAWNITMGRPEIIVAILDTGVDYTHPELADNIWTNPNEIPDDGIDNDNNGYIDDSRGWDFVSINPQTDLLGNPLGDDYGPIDNDPMDFQGHGSHVAGIIAAKGNNSIGIIGVAPNCTIMPIRVAYYDGITGSITSTDLIQGIRYAASNGAHILNLSLGGIGNDPLLSEALTFAADLGAILIASIGNESIQITASEVYLPATAPEVISISAVDHQNTFADYSNFGDHVDFAAPGNQIFSIHFDPDDKLLYTYKTGTSQSAPHVAGLAALILSLNESANVKTILTDSALDLGKPGKDPLYGHGLINPLNALALLDSNQPTISHTVVTTTNVGSDTLIQATIIDNYAIDNYIQATMNYKLSTESTFTAIPMTATDSTSFTATLPAISIPSSQVNYYFEYSDLNPDNYQTLPDDAPNTVFTFTVTDIEGPQISFTNPSGFPVLNQDYFSSESIVTLNITDFSAINTASISVTINELTTPREFHFDSSSSALAFTDNTLLLDIRQLNLIGSTQLSVQIDDVEGNRTTTAYILQLSDPTSTGSTQVALDIVGPTGKNSRIINYPNPFSPPSQSTIIAFQLTQPATVTITLYSLHMDIAKRITRSLSAGYHEIPWDGRDTYGDVVPKGVYVGIIHAKTASSERIKRLKLAVIR